MIAIIDYGMGNLASVQNALLKLEYEVFVSNNKELISNADQVILPGVGAFVDAIKCLCDLGLDQTIRQAVSEGKPLLGICLGMQLIFSQSQENGLHTGLNLVPGRVVKFQLPPSFKVPHMGWNSIKPAQESRLFKGIDPGSYFYFVHSYYPIPEDDKVIAAQSNYGINFACAIEQGNLFATQFHPEKSGSVGLKVLKNFAEMK